MSQATVARVLEIEKQATGMRDEASAQAAQLLGDFEREAAATRERILSEARAEAARLRQEGQRAAASERAEAIAQAESDAQEMERHAGLRLDAAVHYILDQVAGRA
jgi:hypothetical protein